MSFWQRRGFGVFRWWKVSALAMCVGVGCQSEPIELVSAQEVETADFGRTALMNAVVKFSDTPTSENAYAKFADTVNRLAPAFNSKVQRDAELRLNILALGPLEAGFYLPAREQMERFATTVWPTILDFSANKDESADVYVSRLCQSKLAFACRNLVPEYWPKMINAHVWRTLKSRTAVAYGRCQWCDEDESFVQLLSSLEENHLKAELLAQGIVQYGQPTAWPQAAKKSEPFTASLVVAFGSDGHVRVGREESSDGNWRNEIAEKNHTGQLLGLHLRPSRLVGELLRILSDVNKAGYRELALIVRERSYPYDKRQYLIRTKDQSFRQLGVLPSDTIQVLVQALDNARRGE